MTGFYNDGMLGISHVGMNRASAVNKGMAQHKYGVPDWTPVYPDRALIVDDVALMGDLIASIIVTNDGEALKRVFSTAMTDDTQLCGLAWAFLVEFASRGGFGRFAAGYDDVSLPRLESSDRIMFVHPDQYGWRLIMPSAMGADLRPEDVQEWVPTAHTYVEFIVTVYGVDAPVDAIRLWEPFRTAER